MWGLTRNDRGCQAVTALVRSLSLSGSPSVQTVLLMELEQLAVIMGMSVVRARVVGSPVKGV